MQDNYKFKAEMYETGIAGVIDHCHSMIEQAHQSSHAYSAILGMLLSIEIAAKKVGE